MSTPKVCAWCSSPLTTYSTGHARCDRLCKRPCCTRCLHASRTPTHLR